MADGEKPQKYRLGAQMMDTGIGYGEAQLTIIYTENGSPTCQPAAPSAECYAAL